MTAALRMNPNGGGVEACHRACVPEGEDWPYGEPEDFKPWKWDCRYCGRSVEADPPSEDPDIEDIARALYEALDETQDEYYESSSNTNNRVDALVLYEKWRDKHT